MTTYLLNSGGLSNYPAKRTAFYKALVNDCGSKPRVLVCMFAQPREVWEERFAQYRIDISAVMPEGVMVTCDLAMPDVFEQQVKQADAVYITGGDDHLLRYWLSKFDVPALWQGKTIAGNSAGSHVLSKHFWTCDWRACMDGLGIVNVKFLAHYRSAYGENDPRGPIDWESAKEQLVKYGSTSMPVYALEEGEFVKIDVADS